MANNDETRICDHAYFRYQTDVAFNARVKTVINTIKIGWPDGAGQRMTSDESNMMTMGAAVALYMREEGVL